MLYMYNKFLDNIAKSQVEKYQKIVLRQKIKAHFSYLFKDDTSLLMLTDDEPLNSPFSHPPANRGNQLSLSVEPSTRPLLLYQRNVLFQHSSILSYILCKYFPQLLTQLVQMVFSRTYFK